MTHSLSWLSSHRSRNFVLSSPLLISVDKQQFSLQIKYSTTSDECRRGQAARDARREISNVFGSIASIIIEDTASTVWRAFIWFWERFALKILNVIIVYMYNYICINETRVSVLSPSNWIKLISLWLQIGNKLGFVMIKLVMIKFFDGDTLYNQHAGANMYLEMNPKSIVALSKPILTLHYVMGCSPMVYAGKIYI